MDFNYGNEIVVKISKSNKMNMILINQIKPE